MTRILFITYEHAISTFSGNGVYAMSQTSALASLGYDVVVLSAYPDALELENDDRNAIRVRSIHCTCVVPSLFGVPWHAWSATSCVPHSCAGASAQLILGHTA